MNATIRKNPWCPATICAALSLLAGCTSSLTEIDRQTDQVVKERTSSLLGATVRPELTGRSYPDLTPNSIDAKTVSNRNPLTFDPPASDLFLKPADEARDAAAKLAGYGKPPPPGVAVLELDLTASLKQAQQTCREYLRVQDDYLLSAINLLIERHLWGPQLFGSTTAQSTATGDNGVYAAPLQLINELRAVQKLPEGGQVEAKFLWDATQQLSQAATDRYVQASSLVLAANIPLMRGAGLAASEDLTQAERNLVYAARAFEGARRALLVNLAKDYFSLLQQQRNLENQELSIKQLKELERRTAALVEAGRLAEFQKNIAANDVLTSTSTLASQREQFMLSLDRYKLRIGLDIATPVVIKREVPFLPEPDTTPDEATRAALEFRLDLQISRDRFQDAQRRVLIADNNTMADVSLFGSATARTSPNRNVGQFNYVADDSVYTAGVRVDWPLDRTVERMNFRTAQIEAERARRDTEFLRDTVIIEARAAVREIDRARFALTLAEQAVKINQRRAKEQELKADEITAQESVDTANALLNAENSRAQAVTDLRNAVLDYLLTTGQLRVDREGLLQLPVLEQPPATTPPEPVLKAP